MAEDVQAQFSPPPDDPLHTATPAHDDVEARHARASVMAGLFGAAASEPVTVGRYEVRGRLGAGGMGVVYRAHDPDLDRDVAVKLLNQEGGRSATHAETGQARLVREARAMARLAHPNVIHVYDVGTVDDGVFIAMELVEGRDLATWLAGETDWREALRICVQAGEGLAAAHEAGVVHRDFKPENVLVGDDGRVRVVDFGLAGGLANETAATDPGLPADDEAAAEMDEDGSLTKTGAMLGTPKYMAPEQYEAAAQTTVRGDQFSFCVTAYEAVYGVAPFEGDTIYLYRENVMKGNVRPPPADSPVPRRVFDRLVRGMALEPEDRYPDLATLLCELQPVIAPRVRGRKRRWAAVATGVVAVALGSVAFGFYLGDDEPGDQVTQQSGRAVVVPQEAAAAPAPEPAPPAESAPPPEETPEPALEPAPTVGPETKADTTPVVRKKAAPKPYRACYYSGTNKLLDRTKKRRPANGFLNVGNRGVCYSCAQQLKASVARDFQGANECRRSYQCRRTDEANCPD